MVIITRKMLYPNAITRIVRKETNGAIVTFMGTTRKISEGKEVLYLEYECYESMALRKLEEIKNDISEKWRVEQIAIAHRFGRINIEGISLIVAVGSPHRMEAFQACMEIVDRIKQDVPIWKKEVFADGEVWVGSQNL
jgi:molybdopterin synthase catalytic subunit